MQINFRSLLLTVGIAGHSEVSISLILPVIEAVIVLFLHLFVYRLERQDFCWLLLFCFNLHYLLSQANDVHWRYLAPLAALLCALVLGSSYASAAARALVPKGAVVPLLLIGIGAMLGFKLFRIPVRRALVGPKLLADVLTHRGLSDAERVMGSGEPEEIWRWLYPEESDLRAVRYFRDVTAPNDPIFAGVQDHSTVHFNNLRIYWLCGRPFGSPWFQLEARIASEPDVQKQIIADFERNNVRRLIIDREQRRAYDLSKDRRYVGSSLLDHYIFSNYSEEIRLERYSVFRRQ